MKMPRNGSPSGGSILITSAPQSDRMPPVAGPATQNPSSTTFVPSSGPGMSIACPCAAPRSTRQLHGGPAAWRAATGPQRMPQARRLDGALLRRVGAERRPGRRPAARPPGAAPCVVRPGGVNLVDRVQRPAAIEPRSEPQAELRRDHRGGDRRVQGRPDGHRHGRRGPRERGRPLHGGREGHARGDQLHGHRRPRSDLPAADRAEAPRARPADDGAPRTRAPLGTAFTVSIDARHGIGSGISANDRAKTIHRRGRRRRGAERHPSRRGTSSRCARAPAACWCAPARPRAAVDLARLAGLKPAAVICEIMKSRRHAWRVSPTSSASPRATT